MLGRPAHTAEHTVVAASTSCVDATPANYAIIVGTSDRPPSLTVVNNDVDVIADSRWLV